MERISNRRLKDFPPTTLFLDDLAEIVEVFATACKRVEVQIGEFRIDDPEELTALASKFDGSRFPDVSIQGYDPYVNLDLRMLGATGYISEDSIEQRGIMDKAREIIRRGRKIDRSLLVHGALAVLTVLVSWQFSSGNWVIASVLGAVAVACVALAFHLQMKSVVVIRTTNRRASPGFLARKKDDILLAAISAIFGAVFGAVVAYMLGR